ILKMEITQTGMPIISLSTYNVIDGKTSLLCHSLLEILRSLRSSLTGAALGKIFQLVNRWPSHPQS
ncbi:hypothetical protein E2320_006214, partial [Naja naja]